MKIVKPRKLFGIDYGDDDDDDDDEDGQWCAKVWNGQTTIDKQY